ncbi:MAG: alpha/beta fold hydrolase [Promethearchaeota archaeon]|jgi:pimeloyl-ACP methyl ester carboxylesterase
MPYFDNDGIKIYYEIVGQGPPVIMIHGFSSSIEANWRQTNWVKFLKEYYRLILLDCRGHGKSDKPYDPSYYGQKMSEDIIKLMEFLSIEKANFIGYSMGAFMTFRLLLNRSDLFISATLGGFVLNLKQGEKERSNFIDGPMTKALEAESLAEIKDPMIRGFR